jgi:hypothetical protein
VKVRYLGGLSGAGVLRLGTTTVGRVEYDFEGYLTRPGEVSGSGEIRTTVTALKQVFGQKDVHLLTDDGKLFDLKFSQMVLTETSKTAHVDVTGELRNWQP